MFKKTSDDLKTCIIFSHQIFFDFSRKIDANHAKIMKHGLVRKNRQRIHVWNAFCWHTIEFWLIWGSLATSRNVPAASQKPSIFSSIFDCLRKSARIGPREAPGKPKASPRHLQRSILRRFWIDFPGGFPDLLFRRSNDFFA